MRNEDKASVCSPTSRLIFSCSGAADVGEISDKTARKLTKDGMGKMFCLAGIGGRVEPIMAATNSAAQILTIDGCGLDCAKNCLQQVGVNNFQHLRITDMGMEKGKSPATDERLLEVAQKAKELFDS